MYYIQPLIFVICKGKERESAKSWSKTISKRMKFWIGKHKRLAGFLSHSVVTLCWVFTLWRVRTLLTLEKARAKGEDQLSPGLTKSPVLTSCARQGKNEPQGAAQRAQHTQLPSCPALPCQPAPSFENPAGRTREAQAKRISHFLGKQDHF